MGLNIWLSYTHHKVSMALDNGFDLTPIWHYQIRTKGTAEKLMYNKAPAKRWGSA